MSSVCAVVVAGGCGARFGNPGGKQLVNVAGKPLMTWSIRAFDRSAFVSHIVVVCPAEKMDEMRRQAIDPYNFATPITFAEAGKTRQDSTRSGVEAVPAGYEYVAIHDAARPLITAEVIDRAICSLRCGTEESTAWCAVRRQSTRSRSLMAIALWRRPRVAVIGLRRRRRSSHSRPCAVLTLRALADGFVGTDRFFASWNA